MRAQGLTGRARALVAAIFRDRQVFLRAGGIVRFHTLTRRRQVVIAGVAAAVVGWTVFVTALYFSHDARLAASDARVAEMRKAYDRLVAERDAATAQAQADYRGLLERNLMARSPLAALEDARRERRAEFAALEARNAALGAQIAELRQMFAALQAERDKLAASEAALTGEREGLKGKLAALGRQNGLLDRRVTGLSGDLSSADSRIAELARERDSLQGQVGGATRELGDLRQNNAAGEARLAALGKALEVVTTERDKVAAARVAADGRVAELEHALSGLQADQKLLIARLNERAASHSVAVERTIAMTGLDVNRLLAEIQKDAGSQDGRAEGVGGPFIAYRPGKTSGQGKASARSSEIERVVSSLDHQEERREGLRKILARLPLAAPLEDYRVMSGFGRRIDPINGQLAMHAGVDLASELEAPVMATAPGVVVFAGWNGLYGKMVELDHGMGIHTRYAHLRSTLVEPGRRVAARAQIGVMGSSGRSTGPHLHYEVLVDGRAQDPVKFMRAGQYVLDKN